MTFRVGQKVVCVSDFDPYGRETWVKVGSVYTVASTFAIWNIKAIRLQEAPPEFNRDGWVASMFRPAVERKTDISIFTAMLKPSKVDA